MLLVIVLFLFNQSINQSIKQASKQAIKSNQIKSMKSMKTIKSIKCKSIKSINRSIDPSIHQSINQSINQSELTTWINRKGGHSSLSVYVGLGFCWSSSSPTAFGILGNFLNFWFPKPPRQASGSHERLVETLTSLTQNSGDHSQGPSVFIIDP